MNREYIALMPAYEPDEKMLSTIDGLRREGFDVIVVDDGSGSVHEQIFIQASEAATVLTHKENRGKGAALKTCLKYINKHKLSGYTNPTDLVIVTVDADGQHLARDARQVAKFANANPGTLVLGSRKLNGNNIPLRSRFGNGITRFVFKLATGLAIYDTQTGLRAFTADLISLLEDIDGERYEYEINVLMKFAASGIPIREEEIDTVYIEDNKSSHFNTIKDSWRIYREILKFSASSLISFLIDYGIYALILTMTGWLALANIGARIVSATTNFLINRHFVFKSKTNLAKSAIKYFALAGFILIGNTAVLQTLVTTVGINEWIAKVFTELIFFAMSWLVQRYAIFYRSDNSDCAKDTDQIETLEEHPVNRFVLHGGHQKRLKGVRQNG